MKKILFSLAASVFLVLNSFGQSNNPHNQLGLDVINIAQSFYKDYMEGKVKDVTQETLDEYFKKYLPNYGIVNVNDFNTIFKTLKDSDNDLIIKNAKFSEEGKALLKKTLENHSITKLVDETKNSKISEEEKNSILCVLAINYNLIKPYFRETNQLGKGKGPNIEVVFNELEYNNSSLDSDGLPTIIWGGLGFITGNSICGLPCGVIGGAVGLVLGGWINDRGRTTFGSSSSSSGSSNNGGSGGWHPQP
jgi:hypothetical protein